MKKKWNTDRILSFTAIFLSLLSLFFFIYEINLTRKHNRLSVMPRLHFDSSFSVQDSIQQYTYLLENRGLGPAIIDSIAIVYQGKHYPGSFGHFLQRFYPDLQHRSMVTTSLQRGNTMIANSGITLLQVVPATYNDPNFLAFYEKISRSEELYLEVFYKSIYGEKWKLCSQDSCTEPVLVK